MFFMYMQKCKRVCTLKPGWFILLCADHVAFSKTSKKCRVATHEVGRDSSIQLSICNNTHNPKQKLKDIKLENEG